MVSSSTISFSVAWATWRTRSSHATDLTRSRLSRLIEQDGIVSTVLRDIRQVIPQQREQKARKAQELIWVGDTKKMQTSEVHMFSPSHGQKSPQSKDDGWVECKAKMSILKGLNRFEPRFVLERPKRATSFAKNGYWPAYRSIGVQNRTEAVAK